MSAESFITCQRAPAASIRRLKAAAVARGLSIVFRQLRYVDRDNGHAAKFGGRGRIAPASGGQILFHVGKNHDDTPRRRARHEVWHGLGERAPDVGEVGGLGLGAIVRQARGIGRDEALALGISAKTKPMPAPSRANPAST